MASPKPADQLKRRTSTLGEDMVGDPTAKPGSQAWAIYMRGEIAKMLKDMQFGSQVLTERVAAFKKHEGWRQLEDYNGCQFRTYEAFCTTRPPRGLGYRPVDIDAIVAERKSREAQDLARTITGKELRETAGNPHEEGNCNNVTIKTRGNSAEYWTARIARDHPDIHEAMKRGEYPSVRQAAIAAGIVRVPTPLEVAQKAYLRLTEKERGSFQEWTINQCNPNSNDS